MNERIRELAEQAGLGQERWNTTIQFEQFMEKFAELIVKETLQVARAGIEYSDSMEDAVYKYFGVEE